MLQYSEEISEYVKGLDQEQFAENTLIVDACVLTLAR